MSRKGVLGGDSYSSILFKPITTYRCDRRVVVKIDSEVKNSAMDELVIEIKLSINHRLFEQGYITDEMYSKAKELIIKQAA